MKIAKLHVSFLSAYILIEFMDLTIPINNPIKSET